MVSRNDRNRQTHFQLIKILHSYFKTGATLYTHISEPKPYIITVVFLEWIISFLRKVIDIALTGFYTNTNEQVAKEM